LRQRAGSFARFATPVRVWIQRFAFLMLLALSAALIIMSEAKFNAAERVRTYVIDAFAPILEVMSSPVATVTEWADQVEEVLAVQEENEQLRGEIARLQHWEGEAERLKAENQSLRTLINVVPENEAKHLTARVIADTGGAFVRSLLLGTGASDGVRKGLAVVNSEGLVGRVTSAGQRASRVLLITDLNSRIPVVIQSTKDRAILAGDNSQLPRLDHLPAGAPLSPGDRVVTSGHGGVFPPGIAVGVVASSDDEGVRVRPFVNWDRLEYVRVVDYMPKGILDPAPPVAPAIAGMDGQ
jgi:rod shape-determining protein MreC